MPELDAIAERARAVFDRKNVAREQALALSREIIRTSANTIRAAHRGELDRAREMLRGARDAGAQLRRALADFPELYAAGYVHDCQKELAEAAGFLSILAGSGFPDPDELGVEYAAYLNGLGETIGELRRYALDLMRQGRVTEADGFLGTMDEIYFVLVTIDYPDALTGGLRRTTDGTRGIIEKTRGELTTALRQEELRSALDRAMEQFALQGTSPTLSKETTA
jgi:translin